MSNENFERKAEFILEQQARLEVKLGQLDDLVARFAQATADRFHLTERTLRDHHEKFAALVSAQIQTEENLNKLEESQNKTDEQLRNLIAVVDRYFSNGRNGEQKR